jgi:ubiquitin carboxyl-terminal hydrolase 48
MYELTAVLIHRGPSAYSGHYIAHVRDPVMGVWRRLNDEETGVLESKKDVGAEVSLACLPDVIVGGLG